MEKAKWSLISSKKIDVNTFVGRSSHSLNFIDKKLFVFGGENQPRIPIDNNLLKFDLTTNTWCVNELGEQNQQDQVPSPRMGHASCSFNNKLYLFGGREAVNMEESSLNDLYTFDIESNKWIRLDNQMDAIRPMKRSYHTMCALDNKLYVFGGCSADHGRLNDLFEYDLTENKWTKLETNDLIVPRGGSSLNAYENSDEKYLYVTGGFCGNELDDCWKYDIINRNWTKLENLPRHLSVFASASVLDDTKMRLIIHGGEVDPSTLGHNGAGEFSQTTYVFDGKNWKLLEFNNDVIPSSRGWHAACYHNGFFYIYGGNLENNVRTDELWQLKFN